MCVKANIAEKAILGTAFALQFACLLRWSAMHIHTHAVNPLNILRVVGQWQCEEFILKILQWSQSNDAKWELACSSIGLKFSWSKFGWKQSWRWDSHVIFKLFLSWRPPSFVLKRWKRCRDLHVESHFHQSALSKTSSTSHHQLFAGIPQNSHFAPQLHPTISVKTSVSHGIIQK